MNAVGSGSARRALVTGGTSVELAPRGIRVNAVSPGLASSAASFITGANIVVGGGFGV